MPLLNWDTTKNKQVDGTVAMKKADVGTANSGIYCPQNRWGTLEIGDGLVGFAHVKEGKDGQLVGLKKMLDMIATHKGKAKANAFACGSITSNPTAKAFREKVMNAIKSSGIEHHDSLFDDPTKGSWVATLKQGKEKLVLGTMGLVSCIGVLAWSPTTIPYELSFLDNADKVRLSHVNIQMPGDATLEEVDLTEEQFQGRLKKD